MVLVNKNPNIYNQKQFPKNIYTNLGRGWEIECLKLLIFVSNTNSHGSNYN